MSSQTLMQQILTVTVVILATMLTRFLPFLCFPEGKKLPDYIQFLGRVLPTAVFGLLVVFCLKDVTLLSGSRGIPELCGILLTTVIHLLFRKMFLSMAAGTALYILLVNFVFPG